MLKLKELRERNNLTQTEIALKLGVKPNTITQYESGARNPSIENLKAMSKIFGCTVDELLGVSDEK